MKVLIVLPFLFVFAFALGRLAPETVTTASRLDSSPLPRSGCCSHHGGECGCRGGRALCCDNTLSPSCGCD